MDPLLLAQSALGVAGLALVVSLVAWRRAGKLQRTLAKVSSESGELDLVAAVTSHAERMDDLQTRLAKVAGKLSEVDADIASSLRHMSVVRFNALSDLGGQFSFAAALLDDNADGIVFTSIQGHNQARIYAKPILGGKCDVPLSEEEIQAIQNARPQGTK